MKKKLLYLLSATSVLAPLVAVSCGQKTPEKPVDPVDANANVFKQTHAIVLSKNESNIAATDEARVNAALSAYGNLSDAVKAKLTSQKTLLDKLSAKIAQLKQANAKGQTTPTPNPTPGKVDPGTRGGQDNTSANEPAAVTSLKNEVRTLLGELPTRNPKRVEVERTLNQTNNQASLEALKTELTTLKTELNEAYTKLQQALNAKLPNGNSFKTRTLNLVTVKSSEADEVSELEILTSDVEKEVAKLKQGVETLKSELKYFHKDSQFKKDKETEFEKELNTQTYLTDTSQLNDKLSEIRSTYVSENNNKLTEYFNEGPEDTKYSKNTLVKENDVKQEIMHHFVTGKKGATTLSSLPAYDNSKQDWWKVDTTNQKINGNSKNDSSSNTNTVTYHLVERSSSENASNATYEQSRIKAIATMTLIDADSTSTNGSNHVDRNPEMIQNLKVDKERSGKNFNKEHLGTYLTDGDTGEANRIEQWEHVGLDLDNKLVFYKTKSNTTTQSQSDSTTTNTEAVEAEWSKVELYLRTSGSQKNFGSNYNHTIPKQFKLFYSQDGEQWTPVSNQSHQHYYDFVQINSFDLPSGYLNINDNSIPSGSRTFTNNDKDKFFIRIANNVSAFAIEFKPVKAKYMKVEWVSARNELTKENVSQNRHANGRYFKNNDTLEVGSPEWKSYFKSNAPEEKKSKVTGDLDHAFVEVKFFSPSAEHNPYKKAEKEGQTGQGRGLDKIPNVLVTSKKPTKTTNTGSSGSETTTQEGDKVLLTVNQTTTIPDYDLSSWDIKNFKLSLQSEDKLDITSPRLKVNVKEVNKYYAQTNTASQLSSTSSTTNSNPVAVELEIKDESDGDSKVWRVVLGQVPTHKTFKEEEKQKQALTEENNFLSFLLKADIERWSKVEITEFNKKTISDKIEAFKNSLTGANDLITEEHLKTWAEIKNNILDFKKYSEPVATQENGTTVSS